ncbi:MAG TPA: hypothetical protein VFQ35_22410 [Polyangiaceae bacterium]|nr:hypothetical protein [Polyangiaceae bacterium]
MRPFVPLLASALALVAVRAEATPRPLPFTYQHEQLDAGEAELEQYADFTPVRARAAESADLRYYGLTQFQTEFEYGLTSRLELGLYLTYVPTTTNGFAEVPRATEGNGLKQRLRWQLAPTGEWPIDVALYGEVVENEREVELEAKVILQRRFDRLRLIANIVGEREFYYDGTHDLVFAPSAGVTFEASPRIQPGFEWWMRSEYPEENAPSPRPFSLGPHHYAGPTLMAFLGRTFVTTGAYVRLSDTSHTMALGEGFGRVWFRMLVGVGL